MGTPPSTPSKPGPGRRRRSAIGSLLELPWRLLQSILGAVVALLRLGPAYAQAALAGVLRSLREANSEADPALSAAALKDALQRDYGDMQPDWQVSSWQEAARQAHSSFRFLFVYLHSPHHQDTKRFCAETLSHPELALYASESFTCWAGSIAASDAHRLSKRLRVTGYPFCALLAGPPGALRLAAAVQGPAGPAQLKGVLQRAEETHGALFVAERHDRQQQELSRQLRDEQDTAYQESLAADRERERRERDSAAAAAAAAREAAQAAAAKEAALEEAARRVADRARQLAERRSRLAAALPPEAPLGAAQGVASIRLRLPSGSTHQRAFLAGQPLQVVADWAGSLPDVDALSFSLATAFPRRVFSGDALRQPLAELGLAPQAVLLLQATDE